MCAMCIHRVLLAHEACFNIMSNCFSLWDDCPSRSRRENDDGREDCTDDSSDDGKGGLGILLVPGPDYFRGPSFLDSD